MKFGKQNVLVLDTHALVWMDSANPRLGDVSRQMVDHALHTDKLAVSAISYWEVAMLQEKGRLRVEIPLEQWRDDQLRSGLAEIPADGVIGMRGAQLRDFHGDTADRIIVATAIRHGATLLTSDAKIHQWPGELKRQRADI